jgi:hypothetical protein
MGRSVPYACPEALEGWFNYERSEPSLCALMPALSLFTLRFSMGRSVPYACPEALEGCFNFERSEPQAQRHPCICGKTERNELNPSAAPPHPNNLLIPPCISTHLSKTPTSPWNTLAPIYQHITPSVPDFSKYTNNKLFFSTQKFHTLESCNYNHYLYVELTPTPFKGLKKMMK